MVMSNMHGYVRESEFRQDSDVPSLISCDTSKGTLPGGRLYTCRQFMPSRGVVSLKMNCISEDFNDYAVDTSCHPIGVDSPSILTQLLV